MVRRARILFLHAGLMLVLHGSGLGFTAPQQAQSPPSLAIFAPTEILESDGALALAIDLPAAAGTDTVITVTATLLTPASQQVTIPAGAIRGYVFFWFNDDTVIQGMRQTVLRAAADGFTTATSVTLISDDDKADVGLILPVSITEGASAQGTVTLSQAAAYPVVVVLAAESPGLSLPVSVTVPTGFTAYNFIFTANNDTVIGADFAVSVTATMPTWNTSATDSIQVLNNDPRILTLVVPGPVPENGTAIQGRVSITGTLTAPLAVSLTSNSVADLEVPSEVVIPAGQTEVSFNLSPVNIPGTTGTRWVTITAVADTFANGSVAVAVTDVTVASLSIGSASAWVQIGTNFGLGITARDLEGVVITSHSGPVQAQWENATTGLAIGPLVEGAFSNGQANLVMPVPNTLETLRIRVVADGHETRSAVKRPYRLLGTSAAAIAVDAVRGHVLFTSGSAAAAGYVDTLVTVDPLSGSLSPSAFIGSDPRTLAISDDGAFAYVGLWSSSQIVQYNLSTNSVVRSFNLVGNGYPWNSYTYRPYDVEAVPGEPGMVMVGQQATQSSYTTVTVYRDGNFVADNSFNYESLASSKRPGVVYGYNNLSTGYDFGALIATTTTLTVQNSTASPFAGFYLTIEADGDLVIGSNGVVADGQMLFGRGKLALPSNISTWAVAADTAARRFYAADSAQGLFVFDAHSLRQISQISLPPGTTSIAQIKRWGSDGLALRLASGAIMLITHPDIAPTSAPADLEIDFASTDGELQAGVAREFTVNVTNHGPNEALAVRAWVMAPNQFNMLDVQAGDAVVESSGSSFFVQLGNLSPGASRSLRFSLRTSIIGPNLVTATVLSDSIDNVPANDAAELPVSVLFADTPNSVHAVELYAVDMVAHPTLPRVYLSTGKDGAASLANRVLELDARTGKVLRSFYTGQNPRALAITDDGQYLYVALGDVTKVLRIKLQDFSLALEINLPGTVYGNSTATDLVALPGQPNTVAMAFSYYGIYIFDDATVRTGHTGVYDGSRIEIGNAPDVLFAYDDYTSGFEFTRMRITAAGLTQEASRSVFSGYGVDFVSAGGLALSANGYLVNGSDLTLRGILTGMTYNNGQPALEPSRQRAYAVVNNTLRSYDTNRLNNVRQLALPATTQTTRKTIRWGEDGIAVLQGLEYLSSGTLATGRIIFVRTDMVPSQAPYDLELLIDTPTAGTTTVTESSLLVSGRVFAAAGIDGVSLNGVSAGAVDGLGRWSKNLILSPGLNEISVLATTAGVTPVQKLVTLAITYDQPAPTVSSALAVVAQTGTAFTYGITATHEPISFNASGLPTGLSVNPATGVISGMAAVSGLYEVTISATNGTGTGSAVLFLDVMPYFDSWLRTHFSEAEMADQNVSGPNADPDSDGFANLVEYALGLNPKAYSSTGAPEINVDATHWLYTYTRPSDRPDITYAVEVSTDLVGWGPPEVPQVEITTEGGLATWQAKQPLSSGSVFFRLKVTQ